MRDERLERRAARHAALGDPVRLAIVDELATSDRSPIELRRLVGIESNLLAHHLDVLEQVGMINRSRSSGDGRRRYVHLVRSSLPGLHHGRRVVPGAALFVCTRNSARSQLAAALWRSLADAPAESAGTHPADRVHPGAIAAAKRARVAMDGTAPRSLDELGLLPSLVITVCDQAHEEIDPPDGWLHWSIPDPVPAGSAKAFDAAVDELRKRIGGLLDRTGAMLWTELAERSLADEVETGSGALHLDLTRRLVAEGLGTGFLVIAVIGSGIMASRLSPDDVGLQLLENAAATAGALIGLILMFGAVSGAHFNPVVTLVDRLFGTLTTRDSVWYVVAQCVGGCLGAIVANLMFELPAVEWSTKARSSGALWLSEVVATVGLLLVIHGCVRTGRAAAVPYAVGVWIGGAYFFTSSTSFANPAVTISRTMSDSFAGIEPSSAPMFIVMQVFGALLAFAFIRFLYPRFNAPANVEGLQIAGRPSVMFMCIHNAGRSQMAAGWLRHLAGDRIVVYSGGSEPADQTNPAAVAAMAEVGIDITSEFPKPWTDEIVRASDVVVTMGCGDACPLFPGKRYEDWQIDDPAGQDVAAVVSIRDDIRARVEQLMASLGITPAHSEP